MDAALELIAVPSTADRPAELKRALDFVVAYAGPGFEVEWFESHGKPSALLWPSGPRPRFRVLLNGHVDVVPGTGEQFHPTIKTGRLYGRGAHDMKLATLVLTDVFRELAREVPYPLGLQLVTDEEVGGFHGTAHQIAEGVEADFVVIGEQSALRVVNESKGILQIRLHATGRTAHAAYLWNGDNALLTLHAAIGRLLERYPLPAAEEWVTTVNVARIETPNTAVNQVPGEATAWLDIRFPPQDSELTGKTAAELTAYLESLCGVRVTIDNLGAPHWADPHASDVALLRAAARDAGFSGDLLRKHGAADGRFYYAAGTNAVIFGPGGDGLHGPEEYADLATVAPYRQALTTFLRSLQVSAVL